MEFPDCKVTAVKADIADGELKVTFSMKMNDDSMREAENLGFYKNNGKVDLRVIPQQPPLLPVEARATVKTFTDPNTGEIKDIQEDEQED